MVFVPAAGNEAISVSRPNSATNHGSPEPSKILRELRYGELAHFKLIPHPP
jgi:hypothetical protein